MFTPAFRAALTSAAAGVFLFVAGVSLIGVAPVLGLAAALTGALLLAVAFPRLWSALPGLPTGRIDPPVIAPTPHAGPLVELFADLPADTSDLAAPPPAPPPGVDPHTGEVLPDRYAELEDRLGALGEVVAEQSDLFARAFAELRAELRPASAAQTPPGPKP